MHCLQEALISECFIISKGFTHQRCEVTIFIRHITWSLLFLLSSLFNPSVAPPELLDGDLFVTLFFRLVSVTLLDILWGGMPLVHSHTYISSTQWVNNVIVCFQTRRGCACMCAFKQSDQQNSEDLNFAEFVLG